MGEVSNGFAHFAFIRRRASADMLRHGTALALTMLALVMTKERAVAVAEPSVLPQRTEFQRRR